MTIAPPAGWQRLSPADGHYAFGYYDRNPWNADQTLHLALRLPQSERLPAVGETAEVGVLDLAGRFTRLATTRAWCHQQGAMTLWLPHRPGCFVYNDWDERERRLVARIYSLRDGLVGAYPRPLYAMAPNGRWAATLNFARIPRRGYTYADATLDTAPLDLDGDGIFTLDLLTAEVRLAVSYRQLLAIHPARYTTEGKHTWLNHLIINGDSTRLLVLLRHCAEPHRPDPWPWFTHMYTANRDGSDLACPLPHPYWIGISHQIWGRTPREVLVDANWQGQGSEYVVFDERVLPLRAERISRGMGPMGHLIFAPDGQTMLADTYPVEGWQRLALVDCATGEWRELGRFRHQQPAGTPVDVRCDLHPRWSPDGRCITVDSLHDGPRAIYLHRR
jgi:hypothetical protein